MAMQLGKTVCEATMDDYYRLGLNLIEEREQEIEETGRRIDDEVDNMTAEQINDYCAWANTDELWEIHSKVTVSAIDRDWHGVEAHTKALVQAVKDHMWSNAK